MHTIPADPQPLAAAAVPEAFRRRPRALALVLPTARPVLSSGPLSNGAAIAADVPIDPELAEKLELEFGDDDYVEMLGADDELLAETMCIYQAEALSWVEWLHHHAPHLDIAEATAAHVTTYLDQLLASGRAQNTARLALLALRAFYDYRLAGTATPNPARAVPVPERGLPPLHIYTPDEAKAILAAALKAAASAHAAGDTRGWLYARRDHAMLSTVYYAGLRRIEVRRLRSCHLELAAATIRVQGKGDQPRTIKIPPALVAILRAYLAEVRDLETDDDFVFAHLSPHRGDQAPQWINAGTGRDENRLLLEHIREAFTRKDTDFGIGPYTLAGVARRYGTLAGVDGPHGPHKWRHTHATACAEAGMDLDDLARRLGHSRKNAEDKNGWEMVTTRYTHPRFAYLADLIEEVFADPLAGQSPLPDLPGFHRAAES